MTASGAPNCGDPDPTVATLIPYARVCLNTGQLDEAEESLGKASRALAQLGDGGGDTLQQVVDMSPPPPPPPPPSADPPGPPSLRKSSEGVGFLFSLFWRFVFFDFTPSGYLLELLLCEILDRLCTDISYLSELDAVITLAESAHEAHAPLQEYELLVKWSYQMLALRCPAPAKKALLTGGGSTYLEPLSAAFSSADSVHRRIPLLFASIGALKTWISTLETCTSPPQRPPSDLDFSIAVLSHSVGF